MRSCIIERVISGSTKSGKAKEVFSAEETDQNDEIILKIRIPRKYLDYFYCKADREKISVYEIILNALRRSANRCKIYKNLT